MAEGRRRIKWESIFTVGGGVGGVEAGGWGSCDASFLLNFRSGGGRDYFLWSGGRGEGGGGNWCAERSECICFGYKFHY